MTDHRVAAPKEYFSASEWGQFQRSLGNAQQPLHSLTEKLGGRELSDLKGEWPARRISWRRGFYTYEIRLELDPRYFEHRTEQYELRVLIFWAPVRFLWETLERTRVLARFSVDELNDTSLVAAALHEAVEGIDSVA